MIEITIETLKRFGGLLALLLFTAALMMDLEMLDEHYMPTAEGVLITLQDIPLLEWALTNSAREIQLVGWAIMLGVLVAFVYFFVWFIALALAEIHIQVGYYAEVYAQTSFPFLHIVGVVCMLVGVLFFTALFTGAELSLFNPFWNAGLLCYGFYIFDLATSMR
jgi:hypothetical protein